MTKLQITMPVIRWDAVPDDGGVVHHPFSSEDGSMIGCDCEQSRKGIQCGAIEAVAIYYHEQRKKKPLLAN